MDILRKLYMSAVGSRSFAYLLVLLLISGSTVLFFDRSIGLFALVVSMSILVAFTFSVLVGLMRRVPAMARSVFIAIVFLLNVMFAVDVYLALQFGKVFDEDIYFVVLNANPNETTGFLNSQLPLDVLLIVLAIILITNYMAYLASKVADRVSKSRLISVVSIMLVGALVTIAVWAVMLFTARPVASIQKATVIGQFTRPFLMKDNGYLETKGVLLNCRKLEGNVTSNPSDSTMYIFILGESDNKFHDSMYGYALDTQPRLTARFRSDQIVRFDNCITHYPVTHKVVKSVFSFSKDLEDMANHSLFPAAFRFAGYYVAGYDNQTGEDCNLHCLADKDVRDVCYDRFMGWPVDYDEVILKHFECPPPRSMTIVHLFGQHFHAVDRVPESFDKPFTIDDYKEISNPYLRQRYCDVDNATAYVDYVVDSILKVVENENACVVYVTDHGEWAIDNESCEIEYGVKIQRKQLMLIPFWVWGSEKFRATNPKWQLIKNAAPLPITNDDISHFFGAVAKICV